MRDIIQDRLSAYGCKTAEDEENAIKEITQEVVLYTLSRTDFFTHASFQGGTCLRIIHGLQRFSEDLDFILNIVNPEFDINLYLENIIPTVNAYGYDIDITGQEKADSNVKKRFIKDSSIWKVVSFQHYSDTGKKIKIKIEVDVNPPSGSRFEFESIDFPLDFGISVQDPGSLFAGKCHALLCRKFVKGRDWFDFLFYISRKIRPNLEFLKHALIQIGPWQGQESLSIDTAWLRIELKKAIAAIDWNRAAADVSRFLKPEGRESLNLWEKNFFLKKADLIT